MDLSRTLAHAGPATRNLIIDWCAAHQPDQVDLIRRVAYGRRHRPPVNLLLCSSCEGGDHSLCVNRLATGTWRPVAVCACLCRYADQGLPVIDQARARS